MAPETISAPEYPHAPLRRRSAEFPALRSAANPWSAIAHWTAPTTEPNSISTPSPVVLTIRPAVVGNERISRGAMVAQCSCGARFVEPHQAAIAGDIGGQDRRQTAPSWSFLRHPGPAQAGEIGGFVQGSDSRHPEIYNRP
jgi:hypothetical protein